MSVGKTEVSEVASPIDSADVQAVSNWLVEEGLKNGDFESLISGTCDRLAEIGVPVARVYVTMRTLHPTFASYDHVWRAGAGIRTRAIGHDIVGASEEWQRSPLRHMLENDLDRLRRRLAGPETQIDFPLFEELQDQGLTDYLACMVPFDIADIRDQPTGVVCSWATDRPGGFREADIGAIDRLIPRFALALRTRLSRQVAINVLDTYVGPASGRRILAGDIRPGMMEVIPAVIFYADLRGFTAISDRTPRDQLGDMLNDYFDCMVRPVVTRGGHVLKYLGDGLLATFEIASDAADPLCSQALGAAADAVARVRALNAAREAEGKPVMELDIALHLGDVLYGNVGAEDRLDFTVIGPAVNEASRIEALCAELGHNVLISEAFAAAASTCAARLEPVGRHELRGVRGAQELFTLRGSGG